MKTRILFVIFSVLLFTDFTPADVIIANPNEVVVISLAESNPDYSFYLCELSIKFNKDNSDQTPDINSRSNKIFRLENFSLKKLTKLSPQTPYQKKGVAGSNKSFYLVAIRKEIEGKGSAALEEKIVNLFINQNVFMPHDLHDDDIYIRRMETEPGSRNQPKVIVNEIAGVDQTGLKIDFREDNNFDTSKALDVDEEVAAKLFQFCAGIFMAFGFICALIWYFRRK